LLSPHSIIPLEFAEREVHEISVHFPEKDLFFHEESTETRVKEIPSKHDVLHFATHGEFNDRQPMQSGLLLTGDKENDGFLQVHEIFGLSLGEANLVALSACDTALSRIYSGDDLVGLSRAFLYAGAPKLLATLWPVQDRSTYLLMRDFYENWQSKDLPPPEALRRAQIQLRSSTGYEHPYYWAPFILIGDWR
jgi:CHAT domain-containing protein